MNIGDAPQHKTIRTIALAALTACGLLWSTAAAGQTAPRRSLEDACKAVAPQPASLPGAESHVYKTAGRPLYLHAFRATGAPGGNAAVIFFFGGGYAIGSIEQFLDHARALQAAGVTAILADYRVRCRDGSTRTESERDGQDAVRWVAEHSGKLDLDPARIVVAGGSAGGGVALSAAGAEGAARPAALVLFNPDPRPPQDFPPMLILHGQADRLVPIQKVRELCAAQIGGGRACTLAEYPGRDHGFFNSKVRQGIDRATISNSGDYDNTVGEMILFLQRMGLATPGADPAPAGQRR